MTITERSLIADIATELPSSIRVFEHHGVDFCCGGKRPLADVCEELGLSAAEVAREIELSAETRLTSESDWTSASLEALTQHIVATYHDGLRRELPSLEALAAKVKRAHGARAPRLLHCIDAAVRELNADLTAHMRKEEQILFPALCELQRGSTPAIPLADAIQTMESEHDRVGELLADLRAATDDFTTPEWACPATRALYHGLASLESDMHMHVHLENNVLFPHALRLAEQASSQHTSAIVTA